MFSLCLLVAALGADSKQKTKVNPVEKVVSLLEKIQAEIEEEGKAEAKGYDEYACFCKEQADNKQYAIEKFAEQIAVLAAKIESKQATVDELNADIQSLNTEIGEVKDDQTEADGIREEENAAYVKSEALLTTAIERMKGAIEALTASKGGMTDAKVNLIAKFQKTISDSIEMADALKIGGEHTKKLVALVQQKENPAAYSYHSNEVISTLESLLKNFKQKKIELDNEEMATRQEYEMKTGARANQLKALEKSFSEKSEQVAALTEEINAHETEKQESENSKAADQNFLDDLAKKCEDKARTYDQRSSTRTAELTAIAKALELLKGDVSKMYPANDLGLVQNKKAAKSDKQDADDDAEDDFERQVVSFLQVALEGPETAAARKKVIGFLTRQATKMDSVVLSTLLVKLKEAPSPFAKVKQMIQDLISRLEDEAAAEASQKEWCDEEMKSATENRDKAQREIETLTALKMEKSALADSLAEDIMTLSQEVADLTKGLAEETTLREEDQATNNQTLADAEAGLEAVKGAIEVLKGFYGEFIQLKAVKQAPPAEGYERYVAEGAGSDGKTVDDMAPEGSGAMPDSDYGGKTDASKSIIGLLEVIESDFENTISTTTSDEEDAESAYQDFKTKSETSIDDKNTLKDTKDGEKTDAELAITQAEADLKTENENLQNALDELEKLKPVCVDSGMSWEERTARREQEIESLKEALKILQETDFGFLQNKRH